jgi:hypothetical protein
MMPQRSAITEFQTELPREAWAYQPKGLPKDERQNARGCA